MEATKILLSINLVGKIGSPSEEREITPYTVITDLEKKKTTKSGVSSHHNKLPQKCVRKVRIPESTYNFWVSNKEVPKELDSFIWGRWSKTQKIRYHCSRIANGNPFTFEIID